jgi:hypothetical protein
MSVNKERPHVFVLPEDDANRQLAVGFFLDHSFSSRGRTFQVLSEAGGWNKVLGRFKSDHIKSMETYPHRFMILVIDFDGELDRLDTAKAAIPEHLAERVFILGVLKEPEVLKAKHGPYEEIGSRLAMACRDDTDPIWDDDLLRHNAPELDRLREHVRPILF